MGIGLIVLALEASVSNYTLPKTMTSLRVELYSIHWVSTAFGIARTVIIPMLGWLSGRVGPRLLYLLCLVWRARPLARTACRPQRQPRLRRLKASQSTSWQKNEITL